MFGEVEIVAGAGVTGLPGCRNIGVEPADAAVLRLRVDDAPVVRIDGGVEAVAGVELEPVVAEDAVVVAAVARPAPVAAVLQPAVDLVRIAVVGVIA